MIIEQNFHVTQNSLGFTKLEFESAETARGTEPGVVIFSAFNIYMFTHLARGFSTVCVTGGKDPQKILITQEVTDLLPNKIQHLLYMHV